MKTPNLKCSSTENKHRTSINQLQTIFQYLKDNVATASMLSNATGVPHKNITRYKRDLELSNKLWEIKKRTCEHTGFKAYYLTTNPEKAPKNLNPQLTIFDQTGGIKS
jgi:hypothetical protein